MTIYCDEETPCYICFNHSIEEDCCDKAIELIKGWIERIQYFSLEMHGKIDLQLLIGAMKAGMKTLKEEIKDE